MANQSVYILDAPDVGRILIEYMKTYLYDSIQFTDSFEGVESVRISEEHPFAALINQKIQQKDDSVPVRVDTSLFPSVTVVCTSRGNNEEVNVPVPVGSAIRLYPEFIDDLEQRGRSQFIVGVKNLQRLKDAMEAASVRGYVYGTEMVVYRRAQITIEIWALNMEVKDKLFDAVDLFLSDTRESVNENYGIMLHEHSIQGERSGQYDFSFGRMLHGASLSLDADYTMAVYITEDLTQLSSVTAEVTTE